MQNTFADWLFNMMLWGGIVTVLVLCFDVLVAPVLGAMTALIALIVIAVVSAFWPRW